MDGLMLTEHGVLLTTDNRGDIPIGAPGVLGLYYQDTRFLSGWEVRINGMLPPLLGVENRGYMTRLSYGSIASSRLRPGGLPPGILLMRTRYISTALRGDDMLPSSPVLYERIMLTSYQRVPLSIMLEMTVAVDFQDVFCVRQFAQALPGKYESLDQSERSTLHLSYTGRDDVRRHTLCKATPAPHTVTSTSQMANEGEMWRAIGGIMQHSLYLIPKEPITIEVLIQPVIDDLASSASTPPSVTDGRAGPKGFDGGLEAIEHAHDQWAIDECTRIETDNPALNRVVEQSLRDLRLLLLMPPTGPYVAAGIPWYATPFGRDGLITALQTLPINPAIARGTLRYLAAHQGRAVDSSRDEEPGKIMHEMRSGETVSTGMMPFNPYYGSIDATPLFLVLLGRTQRWLADDALLQDLASAVQAALAWLDDYGDVDGDGYIEFQRRAGRGITNQGWKDSNDALQFPDGSYPNAPIALVEVQGYVYEARLVGAKVLRRLGDEAGATNQERRAAVLREHFNQDFWLADDSFLAQALDAYKKQIPAVTSNAGHALWSGIVDEKRAPLVARRLLADDMSSGWGVRTLSALYPSYNPLSYHNGSVWPHDTAIVAAGLKRYGHDTGPAILLEQIVAAAGGYLDARLPELYAGLPRQGGTHGPVPYPVSCSPQAWAAGSVFLLLQSVLGLEPDAGRNVLRVRPLFPLSLSIVRLQRLRVRGVVIDLEIEATDETTYMIRCASEGGPALVRTIGVGEMAEMPF